MRATFVLILAALIGGCAVDLQATSWQKPNAMTTEVTASEMDCARTAFLITPGPDLVLGGLLDVGRLALQESRQASAFSSCMSARGYARIQTQ